MKLYEVKVTASQIGGYTLDKEDDSISSTYLICTNNEEKAKWKASSVFFKEHQTELRGGWVQKEEVISIKENIILY